MRRVYDMLCRADSIGVFQVESRAQMNMLPRLKPRCFYDLVIEVAIVRPGPIQGDMVHPYLRRRCGEEPVEFPSPHPDHGPADELRQVLGKTMGVPLFQEQAMRLAMVAAKFSGPEANELRRAMATFRRRGTIDRLRDKMVGRMTARGYPAEFAERCFNQIKGFGEYGFPESHAASFAHLVYVSAWLKCHYPAAFAAALLNSQPMGFYAPAQIVRCAREHGVEAREADVNLSLWDCTLEPAFLSSPGLTGRSSNHRSIDDEAQGLLDAAFAGMTIPLNCFPAPSRSVLACARSTDCAKPTFSASSPSATASPLSLSLICLLHSRPQTPSLPLMGRAARLKAEPGGVMGNASTVSPPPGLLRKPTSPRGGGMEYVVPLRIYSPTCAICGGAAGCSAPAWRSSPRPMPSARSGSTVAKPYGRCAVCRRSCRCRCSSMPTPAMPAPSRR